MWIMIIIIIITVSFTQGWIFKSLLQHKPSDWIWAHQAKCCCWCNLSLCWRSLGCFVAQMVGVAKCCRFHGHCRVFFFEVDLRCISLHQRAPTSIAWDFVLLFVYLRKELCSEKYSTGNLWHTHTHWHSPEATSDMLRSCLFNETCNINSPFVALDYIPNSSLEICSFLRTFFFLVGETAFHRAIGGFGATCVTYLQLPASRLSCWCHLMEEAAVSDWKKHPRKSYIYTATPLKLNQQVKACEKLPKQTAHPMPEAGSDPDPVPIMAFRGRTSC